MTKPTAENPPDTDRGRVIERPDGYYWQDKLDGRMYGPFRTLQGAMQDMQNEDEEGEFEEGETLEEAEAEIGINDWIDPDTGEPAMGTSPHYEE